MPWWGAANEEAEAAARAAEILETTQHAHGSLEIQRGVLELIATGQSLDDVLRELVLSMERQNPEMRGSVSARRRGRPSFAYRCGSALGPPSTSA